MRKVASKYAKATNCRPNFKIVYEKEAFHWVHRSFDTPQRKAES